MRANAKQVLIADDEPDLGELLAVEFQNRGFAATYVLDGIKAFNVLNATNVDVLVTDIRMPNLDGLELTRRLKTRNPRSPLVLFMSAYSDVALPEAYGAGAEGYFTKPFRLSELVLEVERLLKPPAERWSRSPSEAAPQLIEGMLPAGDQDGGAGLAAFGRGGVALRISNMPLFVGQTVALDLHMESGPFTQIEGNGIVRWFAQDADGDPAQFCGIEFTYLTSETRTAFAQWAGTKHIVPYIPDLRRA